MNILPPSEIDGVIVLLRRARDELGIARRSDSRITVRHVFTWTNQDSLIYT